jgi:hypothetical protein
VWRGTKFTGRENFARNVQIYVDTAFIVAAISCVKDATCTRNGWLFAFGSPKSQGKIVHGGTFMATKKKAKKKKH